MTDLNELIRFDPLAEAERITGKHYQEDEMTSTLGFGIHLAHNERLDAALKEADDTGYSSTWDDTLRIYRDLGFETILTIPFEGSGRSEVSMVLWREGILAFLESYGDRVNNAKVYYNIRFREGVNTWDYTSSGHSHAGVWIGDHDARIGVRNTITRLESAGEILSTWVERPWLWLLNYAQENDDYKAVNEAVIAQLPDHVRAAITPVDVTQVVGNDSGSEVE